MPDVEPAAPDFAASGRVGRRNALPDILGPSATAGAPDLPAKLAGLAGAQDGGAEGRESPPTPSQPPSPEMEGKSSGS
ncbi:cAMP-dependent protein kinase inhibitor beta [Tachyglossus aculeatus]|uniref:cAMP-dependent protein kinase inhibitor beta n=1 Tax=Tachyglossus aculeatus TaxID=9261 RepID=UPI0018F333D2|nr:cAMP-dependent protein kinase inhibitor beta [Tachyglossus aculeatus]XP_038596800.1 cAMP-dependent protein kinase inhibitor beta [Tachyglossus aculeatus]